MKWEVCGEYYVVGEMWKKCCVMGDMWRECCEDMWREFCVIGGV